jgi:uncharacterized protein (DUF362 family)
MNRKEFLNKAIKSGVFLSFSPYLKNIITPVLGNSKKSKLVVVRGKKSSNPKKIVNTAINASGGMKKFISYGDTVVVKPNIGFDRVPAQAATTNPDVVFEIVKLCKQAGAASVKVFDRSVNDVFKCYKNSGIAKAAKKAGAEVLYMKKEKYKEFKIGGTELETCEIYTDLLEADKIINVPIAKTHGSAGLTMGMKNWMGVIGGWRATFHLSLHEKIADLAGFIKPTLTILDAIRILYKNGPRGGSLDSVKKMNTIIVSTDQVAADSYGATLFGKRGKDIKHIRLASQKGFGEIDLKRVNIKKIII